MLLTISCILGLSTIKSYSCYQVPLTLESASFVPIRLSVSLRLVKVCRQFFWSCRFLSKVNMVVVKVQAKKVSFTRDPPKMKVLLEYQMNMNEYQIDAVWICFTGTDFFWAKGSAPFQGKLPWERAFKKTWNGACFLTKQDFAHIFSLRWPGQWLAPCQSRWGRHHHHKCNIVTITIVLKSLFKGDSYYL